MLVTQLQPAKYNPRKDLKPGDPEFEKLRRSVEEFGYVEPIIWNKRTGVVVGGHQRLKVLQHLGYTEVDCVVLDIDEQKERALNVALNKISGEWDIPLLTSLLKDLNDGGYDATITGFDVSELSDLFDDQSEIKEDDPPEAATENVVPFSQVGDRWMLGNPAKRTLQRSWTEPWRISSLRIPHITLLMKAATVSRSRTTICRRTTSEDFSRRHSAGCMR